MEHEVLAADPTPFHASQLARFEWALLQARGPLLLGDPPQVLPRARLVSGEAVLLEEGDRPLPSGTKVHLVLARDGKASALLEVVIGKSETPGSFLYGLPRNLPFSTPDQVSLALVDTRRAGEPGEMSWAFHPIVPEVARLP